MNALSHRTLAVREQPLPEPVIQQLQGEVQELELESLLADQ